MGQTRDMNGGLLDVQECMKLVRASQKGSGEDVSERDIERAVERLDALGRGFGMRYVKGVNGAAGRRLIYSVPDELNDDQSTVLELAAASGGKISVEDLSKKLNWSRSRADGVLAHFIRTGFCWVDTQDKEVQRVCWFPSMALAS